MRTYEEIYQQVQSVRKVLLEAGKDPRQSEFLVSPDEQALIHDRPPFHCYELSAARDRMCGLKIVVTAAHGKEVKP